MTPTNAYSEFQSYPRGTTLLIYPFSGRKAAFQITPDFFNQCIRLFTKCARLFSKWNRLFNRYLTFFQTYPTFFQTVPENSYIRIVVSHRKSRSLKLYLVFNNRCEVNASPGFSDKISVKHYTFIYKGYCYLIYVSYYC